MNFQQIKKDPNTNRIGEKWSQEEENQLLEEIRINLSIPDISKIHYRTESAIKSRLRVIAVNHIKSSNMSIETAAKTVNLTVEEVMSELNKKRSNKNSPLTNSPRNTENLNIPILNINKIFNSSPKNSNSSPIITSRSNNDNSITLDYSLINTLNNNIKELIGLLQELKNSTQLKI
jgi:hypothetical protein